MELGIVWPPTWLELARVALNLIKLKLSPWLEPCFHRLGKLANSRQSCSVIVMGPRGRIQTIEWFLAIWLDLAIPFAHPPMYASFDFVTWLELSWEYRLARALGLGFGVGAGVRVSSKGGVGCSQNPGVISRGTARPLSGSNRGVRATEAGAGWLGLLHL